MATDWLRQAGVAAALFMCTGRVKLRCVAVVDGGGQGLGGESFCGSARSPSRWRVTPRPSTTSPREAAGRRPAVGENSRQVRQASLRDLWRNRVNGQHSGTAGRIENRQAVPRAGVWPVHGGLPPEPQGG